MNTVVHQRKMNPFIPLTFIMLLSLVACKEDSATQMLKVEGIEAEIAGSYPVVVTRNFPAPASKGMVRMAPDLHLGRNVFAAEASDRWLKMLEKLEPGKPRNTLPVLFAKSLLFADGETRLVVGQLQCSSQGDGSWSPSSTFSTVLYTIDISNSTKPAIIWEGRSALGTMQHSRIRRMLPENGSADEASVIHEEDLGERGVVRSVLVFKPSKDHSISMERRLSIEENPQGEDGGGHPATRPPSK